MLKSLRTMITEDKTAALLFTLIVIAVAGTFVTAFLLDEQPQWTNVMVTVVLALVTGLYGWHTRQMARASAGSFSEMQKQRYLDTQPWVFPRLLTALGDPPEPGRVTFVNVGKGPAIDIKPFISDGTTSGITEEWRRQTGPTDSRRTGPRWPFLRTGETIEWLQAFESPQVGAKGVIGVEYQDIYGRKILSGWAYRISKVSDEQVAMIAAEPLFPVLQDLE